LILGCGVGSFGNLAFESVLHNNKIIFLIYLLELQWAPQQLHCTQSSTLATMKIQTYYQYLKITSYSTRDH
jgi:hypothetical protein